MLVLTMGTWFAASAVAPALRQEWVLSDVQAALLTTSVQLGFVAGALGSALLNLPDVLDAARLAAASAVLAAAATAALTLIAGAAWAIGLRFVTGVALAGVYPVGMKLANSWYGSRRGFALGILVAALTLGSAMPQLVGGALAARWRAGLAVAAAMSLAGAVLAVTLIRVGPCTSRAVRFEPSYVVTLVRRREARLASLGYLGHMWELYATWTWLPAILAAALARYGSHWPRTSISVVSFAVIGVCGAAGCLVAGRAGERVGQARVAAVAMTVSGTCCLAVAVLFGAAPPLLVAVMAVWGAAVIADSAMFSACLARVVDPRFVGTALTMQTAAGFLLTTLTVQGLPLLAAAAGWRVAVAALGIGPLLGAGAMRRLSVPRRALSHRSPPRPVETDAPPHLHEPASHEGDLS